MLDRHEQVIVTIGVEHLALIGWNVGVKTIGVSLDAVDVLSSFLSLDTFAETALITLLTTRLDRGVTAGQAHVVLSKYVSSGLRSAL